MSTADAFDNAYTGPGDLEVVAVLQRMASARAQLINAERSATGHDRSRDEAKRVDEIEEAHADLLWAQAEMLTSTKNLRKTKAVENAMNRERNTLKKHGYSSFRDYVTARTSTPTADVHLTLARREYEEAQSAWERLQSEMEAAEPTMVIDLTGETPRPIS